MAAGARLPGAHAGTLYRAIWRWHFYAGLFVAPLLVVLAASGLVMLLRGPLDSLLYRDLLVVEPQASPARAPSEQVDAVQRAFPHATPVLFVPPGDPTRSTEVSVEPSAAHGAGGHGHGAATISVFVDPYSARVLGWRDPASTPYGWANAVHGSLLLGETGDAVLEIAAGLAVLLTGTGLLLAWPRRGTWRSTLLPGIAWAVRPRARALHAAFGLWIALPLLFFLLSGLTWTGVWGARLLQAWNTVAVERAPAAAQPLAPGGHVHGDLDRTPLDEVPWALELAPLPVADDPGEHVHAGRPPDLDSVVERARALGFEHFRVNLPRDHSGVWTVSASTMADDVDDPRAERFVHIDRHSGRVLAEVGFDDYSPVARFMASGVPFHQGDLGAWNVAFNAAVCLAVIALAVLGPLLWWQRRPSQTGLAPPLADARTWRRVMALMLLVAVVFPLSAAALAAAAAIDLLLGARLAGAGTRA